MFINFMRMEGVLVRGSNSRGFAVGWRLKNF